MTSRMVSRGTPGVPRDTIRDARSALTASAVARCSTVASCRSMRAFTSSRCHAARELLTGRRGRLPAERYTQSPRRH